MATATKKTEKQKKAEEVKEAKKDLSNEEVLAQMAKMQARIDELEEKEQVQMPNQSLMQEMQKLKQKQVKASGSIAIKSIDDHKNVWLYQGHNHRIGPLHPNNALHTLMEWANNGIMLWTEPRTEAQVEEFKNTKAYKAAVAKNRKQRDKYKTLETAEAFEKFTKAIAKMEGIGIDKVNVNPNV